MDVYEVLKEDYQYLLENKSNTVLAHNLIFLSAMFIDMYKERILELESIKQECQRIWEEQDDYK